MPFGGPFADLLSILQSPASILSEQDLTGNPMINNFFVNIEPAAFGIKLGVHVLSNHICTTLLTGFIRKLKEAFTGVCHQVPVG